MPNIVDRMSPGSALAIGSAIAAGRVTSAEVTEWYLQRIARYNHGSDGLNCVRSISPLARDQARRADAELAGGVRRSPLHGVPYLLKDNVFTTDGNAASAGCRALAGFLPPYEATLVQRLRDAGAVLLGKTNMTEFADFVSDSMPAEFSGAGGVVRNPLGPRYDRGQGSSVGSAASVAAGLCAFAIGTETQNSIQAPAVHSSVVGFKPTVGRVSRHGIVPLVPSQDSPGPLTLTVEDAAAVFGIIAGADPRDTATLAHIEAGSSASLTLRGLRIGIPRRAIADLVLTEARRPAFDHVLRRLADAGAVIVDPCDLPSAEQLHEVRSCVFRTEFKASLDGLLEALAPCGMRSMVDIIDWNRAHPDAIPYGQSLLEASHATAGMLSSQYIDDRRRDRVLSIDAGIRAALASGGVDLLLSPMSAAAKCTGKAGAPVLAIPAGPDGDGLPFGITLYAAPGEDQLVLRAGEVIERVVAQRIAAVLD